MFCSSSFHAGVIKVILELVDILHYREQYYNVIGLLIS